MFYHLLILLVMAPPSAVFQPDAAEVFLTAKETRMAQATTGLVTRPKQAVPVVDTNLVVAARRLARGEMEPRDALIEAGVSDAFVVPIEFGGVDSGDQIGAVRSLLSDEVRRTGPTHFGVGVVGSRAALLFVRRGAILSQFPKRMAVGEKYLLTGKLAPEYELPRLLMATPAGDVIEYNPRRKGPVFWRTLGFDYGPGRYTIEVQANDSHGVQVLNLMEVWVSEPGTPMEVPVVRLRPKRRSPQTVREAERRALDLINRSRRQKGLNELIMHEALVDEARAHAGEMAAVGFFGHVSPARGGLAQRLRSAGLHPQLALENVAISITPDDAHAELLRSPSHLRNILDPDVTYIGIGAHRDTESGEAPVFTFTHIFAKM